LHLDSRGAALPPPCFQAEQVSPPLLDSVDGDARVYAPRLQVARDQRQGAHGTPFAQSATGQNDATRTDDRMPSQHDWTARAARDLRRERRPRHLASEVIVARRKDLHAGSKRHEILQNDAIPRTQKTEIRNADVVADLDGPSGDDDGKVVDADVVAEGD